MKREHKNKNRWLVFTSFVFQIGAIIFIFGHLGKYIDSQFNPSKKYFTLLCLILGVSISIIYIIKLGKKLEK